KQRLSQTIQQQQVKHFTPFLALCFMLVWRLVKVTLRIFVFIFEFTRTQTQLQHATAHFQANEAIDARHIADKVAMEKQLSGLSEKIVLDQRRLQALERDNQKLMQENFVLRQE